ncbi:MAG: exodeoxyribonuclease V subunit beta [Halothiobacillaceae bacterium]
MSVRELDVKTFPLSGISLIEASAGTGKTWTIAALYLRWVLEQGLTPEQILVVTFTEAATSELRERIRNRLAEAARYFRAETDQADPLLADLRGDHVPGQWPACARRLDQAVQLMDEAAIHTIHGWSRRMLREHAFDSGSLFDLELVQNDAEIFDEVVRDYWRVHVYPLPAFSSMALRDEWADPAALGRAVKPLLSEYGAQAREEPFSGLEVLYQQLQQAKSFWWTHRQEIEDLIRETLDAKRFDGRSMQWRYIQPWLASMDEWCQEPLQVLPHSAKARERLTQSGLQAVMKDDHPAPTHPAFGLVEQWLETWARESLGTRILPHAAQWIARAYRQEKQRRAQMGFDDLLTRLADALDRADSALPAVIRAQYPVAMIDEFQDTDPVQYRIFERVCMGGGSADGAPGTLLMIGDPKQAIYAFRGADIHTYLKARRATAGHHYTLARNFRSTEAMVEAANRLFEHAENHPAGAFLFRDGDENPVPYLRVRANGRGEELRVEDRAVPALTLWHDRGDEESDTLNKGQYLDRMSQAAANEIARLLRLGRAARAGFVDAEGRMQRLVPADIAILVRDLSEARAVRQALEARGVRSVYLSDRDSVFDSEEAGDLLHLLRACAEPENESLIRAALATGTLGQSWADLERFNTDERHWESIVERFQCYRRLWHQRGVLPMLRRLLNDWDVPARLLARSDGERRLTNLLHLAERLQAVSAEQEGEQALIRHLLEEIAGEVSAHEEADRIMRLESDAQRVQVITIHKSKGLEYPLVFLPFVGTFKTVDPKKGPVRYHDEQGQKQLVLNPDEAQLARADRERLAEDMRLLYVAVTRARHACWMGLAPMVNGQKKSETLLGHSAVGYLLAGEAGRGDLKTLLDAVAGDDTPITVAAPPIEGREMLPAEAIEAEALSAAREYRGPRFESWWIGSYSSLVAQPLTAPDPTALPLPETARQATLMELGEGAHTAQPSHRDAQQVFQGAPPRHFPMDFPRGPGPGTFLHGLLEWAAEAGFAQVADDHQLRADQVARRCALRGWSEWAGPLADWLGYFLRTELALPGPDLVGGGPLALGALAQWQAELEFWFGATGVDAQALDALVSRQSLDGHPRPALAPMRLNGMLKGFIDLVFEHQGRFYVADYKSNDLGRRPEDYEYPALREAVLEKRYDLQYLLYVLALHRLLRVRLPDYDYQQHLGGVLYLFLRGVDGSGRGVFADRPAQSLIEAMDQLFEGRELTHAA